jgi:hypothetical protein
LRGPVGGLSRQAACLLSLRSHRTVLSVVGSLMRPCATGLAHAACLMRTSGQPWYWWREQTHAGAPSIVSSDLQRPPCKPRCEVSWSEGIRHAHRGPYTLKSGQRSKPSVETREKLEAPRLEDRGGSRVCIGSHGYSRQKKDKPNVTWTGTQGLRLQSCLQLLSILFAIHASTRLFL